VKEKGTSLISLAYLVKISDVPFSFPLSTELVAENQHPATVAVERAACHGRIC
jgi:hypothetical protein